MEALKQSWVFIISLFGYAGFFMVVISFFGMIKKYKWVTALEKPFERIATEGTLIATILAAITVYFPENTRTPYPFSISVSAPLVILSAIAALIASLLFHKKIPPLMINGFALLAIAGTLFRLLSR